MIYDSRSVADGRKKKRISLFSNGFQAMPRAVCRRLGVVESTVRQGHTQIKSQRPISPQVPALSAVRAAAATCNSDGNQSWTEFTPRLSLDYAISDDVMTYASWSRGFRSGGFNGRATTSTTIGPYDPEKVDSYELGLRSTLLDGRLVFNATLFHSEYQDKHESEIYQFGAATETIVNNAAQATIDGLEIEAQFLASELVQLRLTAGMIDGAYEEFLAPERCQGITREGCPRVDVPKTSILVFSQIGT